MEKTSIQIDLDILGGKPVFAGTRVLVQTLFDYLEKDYNLSEFLDDFSSVEREQAIAVLEHTKQILVCTVNVMSSRTLQELWDNEEDSVYDDL
jgi:uncharacterized protein (DUF433 family)